MAKANKQTKMETVDTNVETNTETNTQSTVTNETAQGSPAVTQPTFDIPSLLTEYKNKSGVIRYLHSQGLKVNEIHKLLTGAGWKSEKSGEPIRYQHVRNVLNQPLKKSTSTSTNVSTAPVEAQNVDVVENTEEPVAITE